MKRFLFLWLLIMSVWSGAQSIDLKNINSHNIVDFYEKYSQAAGKQNSTLTLQQGNQNHADIRDRDYGKLMVIQNGNQNLTLFNNANSYPTNAQIQINGNNNYIDIAGSNSISEGMKININANDMTIFMRNY